jgi:DnaJ-domain-containing protein 1
MRVLKETQALHAAAAQGKAGPLMKPAEAAGLQADAYAVLGVAPDAGGGEIKKRYMRLSLLIHPDKCTHKVRAW